MIDSSEARIRIPLLDMARGIAVLAMIVYHFSWDLAYQGFISADVAGDPFWATFAHLTAGSFLALSGIGHVFTRRGGFRLDAFLQRLFKLVVAAGLVSIGTYVIFPDAWVFFGILHMMALGSLILLPLIELPILVLAALAIFAFAAPSYWSSPSFDHPALWFLGLSVPVPVSNDFVPVFPWLSALLLGVIVGRLALVFDLAPLARYGTSRLATMLARIGRYSLPIYLVHQVILFSIVAGAAQILPVDSASEQSRFINSCVVECGKSSDQPTCTAFCGCVASSLAPAGFFKVRGGDPAMSDLMSTAASACQPLEIEPPPPN